MIAAPWLVLCALVGLGVMLLGVALVRVADDGRE
jgi:hypothetical protein